MILPKAPEPTLVCRLIKPPPLEMEAGEIISILPVVPESRTLLVMLMSPPPPVVLVAIALDIFPDSRISLPPPTSKDPEVKLIEPPLLSKEPVLPMVMGDFDPATVDKPDCRLILSFIGPAAPVPLAAICLLTLMPPSA